MKNVLIILATTLLFSCKKNSVANKPDNLVEDAIKFYQENKTNTISTSEKLPRKFLKRFPNWAKARLIHIKDTNIVVVPVDFEKKILIRSNLSKDLLALDDITFLLLKPLKGSSNFEVKWLTILPADTEPNSRFNGIIEVNNLKGEFEYAVKHKNGEIYLSSRNTSKLNTEGIIVIQNYIEGYNYSPDDPSSGYAWQEYVGSSYINISDYNGTGAGGTQWAPSIDYGFYVKGDIASNISPTNFIINSGDDKISDISNYNKCFRNKKGNKYQVSIYVQQPIPGTRATWRVLDGVGMTKQKSPVFVGHTFISIKQSSNSDSIIRNLGFYPSTAVDPLSPTTSGELNNDQNRRYDISLSIDIPFEQFEKIVAYLNNLSLSYNLNSFNCTTFAIEALAKAGINLPRTEGSWPNGGGLNPGDLGEDIKSMKLSSNMSRTIIASTHKNAGSCQ